MLSNPEAVKEALIMACELVQAAGQGAHVGSSARVQKSAGNPAASELGDAQLRTVAKKKQHEHRQGWQGQGGKDRSVGQGEGQVWHYSCN